VGTKPQSRITTKEQLKQKRTATQKEVQRCGGAGQGKEFEMERKNCKKSGVCVIV